MSEYDDQAEKFMEETGTTMDVRWVDTAKYFPDDEQERDIYEIKLSRGLGRSYKFRFGQSLNKTGTGQEPSEYDVFSCLTKYDPGTFDEFCSECGYDTDSRRALAAYKAVRMEWVQVHRLFGDVLEKLREIV